MQRLSAIPLLVAAGASLFAQTTAITIPGDHRKARARIGNTELRIEQRTFNNSSTTLTLRLPPKTPQGCYVPVHLYENGVPLPDSIPIAVSPSGPCKNPAYQFSNEWITKRTGIVARGHTTELALETGGQQHTVDIIGAFFDGDATILRPGALLRFPPPGHCASRSGAYTPGASKIDVLIPALVDDVSGKELLLGSNLLLDDGRYQMTIPQVIGRSSMFWRTVANSQQELSSLKTKGNLRVRGTGGPDLGPFSATLPLPDGFEWLHPPATPLITLNRNLPLEWKAASPGVVILAMLAINAETSRYAWCLCIADANAQRFELPAPLLKSLAHAAAPNSRETAGVLYLVHAPQTAHNFQSNQLETAISLSLQLHTAKVLLRR